MKSKTRAVDIAICDATFISRHPELYHYTTRAGLEGIMKTRTIWAGHYQSLNDSSEVQHFRERFSSALALKFDAVIQRQQLSVDQRRFYAKEGGPEKLARDFVDSLYDSTFEHKENYGRVEPFISSFCTHAADRIYEQTNGLLSQWRSYTGGNGYCVVFDTSALCQLLAEEFDRLYWLHLSIAAVTYDVDGVAVDREFPTLFEACERNLQAFFDENAEPELNTAADFWEGASRFKHRGFYEEREVRIVAIPGTAKLAEYTKEEHPEFQVQPLPDIRQRPANGPLRIALFEGRNVKLPITRVIVGPSRNHDEQAEKVKIARDLLGQAIPVTCSETPWIPPVGAVPKGRA
ncbi:MAG: DUF2971 domain-containing protein [Hyphomicrobiales bacterium]|nr:DUF2971 domain-containing protein [Hyphomicrobiales bacterium]MDE2114579.1 DUF2971 domain-containing protein [Hyphomicrobiales bacterium]